MMRTLIKTTPFSQKVNKYNQILKWYVFEFERYKTFLRFTKMKQKKRRKRKTHSFCIFFSLRFLFYRSVNIYRDFFPLANEALTLFLVLSVDTFIDGNIYSEHMHNH